MIILLLRIRMPLILPINKVTIKRTTRVDTISRGSSMAKCTKNWKILWFAEFVSKFLSSQWSATIAELSSAKLISLDGTKIARCNAQDSCGVDRALTFWKNSFRSYKYRATSARTLFYFQTSKSMKSGARKTNVLTNNAKWFLSTAAVKSSSTKTRPYKFATMSATRCSVYNKLWKTETKMRSYYSSSNTLTTRKSSNKRRSKKKESKWSINKSKWETQLANKLSNRTWLPPTRWTEAQGQTTIRMSLSDTERWSG